MEVSEVKELFLDAAPLTEKGHVNPEIRDAFFKKVRAVPANRVCFDCPARNPIWLSLPFGAFVCLDCSGEHRRMGVHLSFVRSIDMDKFYPHQLVQVARGGNHKMREEFKNHGVTGKRKDTSGTRVDYFSKHSQKLYAKLEKDSEAACLKHGIPWKDSGGRTTAPSSSPEPDRRHIAQPDAETLAACSPTPDASVAVQPRNGYPEQSKLGFSPMKPLDRSKSAAGSGITPLKPVAERAISAPVSEFVTDTRTNDANAVTQARAAPAPVFIPPPLAKQSKKLDDDFDDFFAEVEKEIATGVSKPAPAPEPKKFAPIHVPVRAVAPSGYPAADAGSALDAAPKQATVDSKPMDAKASWAEEEEGRIRMQKFSSAAAISSDAFFGRDDDVSPGGVDYAALQAKVSDRVGTGYQMGKSILGAGLDKLKEYRSGS